MDAGLTFLERRLFHGQLSWPTLQYMVAEVQYGGKITDAFDLRLFNTYGKAWLTQTCLDPNFEFYPGYMIPANKPEWPGAEVDQYRKYIYDLPLVDDPEIFGLHGNADLAYRSSQTKVWRSPPISSRLEPPDRVQTTPPLLLRSR